METPYVVNKISEGFWAIEERGVFMYLVEGKDKAMLVDTGFGTGNLKETVESLTKKPVFVVITHSDGDHVGGNKYFSEIYMHPSDFDRYYEKPENTVNLLPVWEGDVFDLGTRKFEVIHIPGHTPGSIVLFDRENREMICGDTFQYGSIFMFGGGRSFAAFEASVNKILKLKGGIDKLYPGHDKYPVPNTVFEDLLEGLAILKTGTVEGKEPFRPMPAKIFNCGKVSFIAPV